MVKARRDDHQSNDRSEREVIQVMRLLNPLLSNRQDLWMKIFQAARVHLPPPAVLGGIEECERHRPAPQLVSRGPRMTLVRCRTVVKVDSIGIGGAQVNPVRTSEDHEHTRA